MKSSIVDIQIAVSRHFGISVLDMLAVGRSHRVVIPRQLAYWVAAKTTGQSVKQIGRKFDRDHATIFHGIKATERRMGWDADLSAIGAMFRDQFSPAPKLPVWRAEPVVTFGGMA